MHGLLDIPLCAQDTKGVILTSILAEWSAKAVFPNTTGNIATTTTKQHHFFKRSGRKHHTYCATGRQCPLFRGHKRKKLWELVKVAGDLQTYGVHAERHVFQWNYAR